MSQSDNLPAYPARLVFHDDPRGVHFDLFVQVPGQEDLVTYELKLAERSVGESGFRLLAGPPGDAFPLTARRKRNHRQHYWTYAGPVEGRGRIEGRGEGWLECAVLADELSLAWTRSSNS